MQKARRHAINALRPIVGTRFQVLFTPLFGVLFTFPSRYWSTIGLLGVFSLTGWSRLFQTGFLVSRPTQDTAIAKRTYLYGSFTLYGRTFQIVPVHCLLNIAVLLPRHCRNNTGLGYFPFARRYLGNRCFFLFLLLLRCFSSEGWPPSPDVRSST